MCPGRQSMTREELKSLVSESTGNESNICQIYAYRDGEPVYNENWHGFGTEDAVHVMSVTKGVMSLLFGIAITKGYIDGVDSRVLDFFPGYSVKRGEKTIYDVTLRHLLTMTAPYKYRSEPWTRVCTSDDWTKAALDLLGGRNGITGEFRYATLGIQILTGIIENATGEGLIDFANKELFLPLGIPDHIDHGDSSKEDQLNYVMSRSPRIYEWYTDPKGSATAGWGLCMSARDLAVLGELVLGGGEYKGNRIISEEYIHDMLSSHVKLGKLFGYMDYGYLWYRPYSDREVYAALGDGGNAVYVNMEEKVTVGVTGTFRPRIFDRVEFIEKYVLPVLR